MLTHPTLDQLSALGLHGMAKAFAELAERDDAASLTHGEWLALLLEREASQRHDRRLAARLRYARLRHMAAPEDIDWKAARGLDRALFAALLKGAWRITWRIDWRTKLRRQGHAETAPRVAPWAPFRQVEEDCRENSSCKPL